MFVERRLKLIDLSLVCLQTNIAFSLKNNTVYKNSIIGFVMAIRNLKDNSKKPWLCECYPQGREGKRIRKRFSTKGEAIAFERFTMREINYYYQNNDVNISAVTNKFP